MNLKDKEIEVVIIELLRKYPKFKEKVEQGVITKELNHIFNVLVSCKLDKIIYRKSYEGDLI